MNIERASTVFPEGISFVLMNHVANHFTHVPRFNKKYKCNVGAMLLSSRIIDGKQVYSVSSNPYIILESHDVLM